METEKALIFINRNTLNYWFNRIGYILRKNSIDCKIIKWTKEIWINNVKIFFITEKETKWQFWVGRHDTIIIQDVENKLENDFEKTLEEIING